jgi:peroxiredoxin
LVLPSGLNGTPVDPAVPLIAFSAQNSDGTSRSMSDLVDGPTVIWFYPLAGTPG